MADHSMIADLHVAEMLGDLLNAGHCILLSKHPEGEYYGDAGPKRRSIATSLEGCIEGLTDNPRTKVCMREGCAAQRQPQRLWLFGPDKDSADGHASVCKACEAKRIALIGRRKKERAKEGADASP